MVSILKIPTVKMKSKVVPTFWNKYMNSEVAGQMKEIQLKYYLIFL